MEEKIQEGLADFISRCDFDKIPEHFKEDARYRLLDWVGCAYAGKDYPQVKMSKEYLMKTCADGKSLVIGEKRKLPARAAAFINGVAGHVCELDDGHRTAIGHPGSIAVPVALALAEERNATGAEFLKSIIIGYDMFARMGRTVNPVHYKTWHTTGTCGTIAAASAAASILKLDPKQTNDTIGTSATMAGGLVESFGTHAKALNIAEACQNGIDAAALAEVGFTGSHSGLLGKKGFIAATCTEPHLENLENPSEETLVSDTAFYKVYSSCGHTNSPLDALFLIMKENKLDAGEIESIDVETYKVSVDITSALQCETEDQAKFSLPYCFAISILFGSVSLPLFAESYRQDPKVLELAGKVKVVESAEATSRFPKRQAKVTITFRDGSRIEKQVMDSNDKVENSMIEVKFAEAVKPLGEARTRELIDVITTIDKQPDISRLIALMEEF